MNDIVKNNLNKGAMVGIMLTGIVGCSKGPLHEIKNTNMPIKEAVDIYTKSELNNADTKGLDLFKIDTIEISKKDLKEPLEFNSNIRKRALTKNPKVVVKDEWEYGYAVGPRLTVTGLKTKGGFDYHRVIEHDNKYIDSTIVAKVQNRVFANENESKFYIQVEYYGKPDSTIVEVKKTKTDQNP